MAYNLYEMIPVYKEEKKLGLAEAISNNRTLAYCSVVRGNEPKINSDKFLAKARAANPNQIDLYYIDSILVSVGWNKNDDIFTPELVWAARKTPIDKKFNFMHDEKDIIGHMTDSFAVDKNGELLDDDLSLDEIPNEFDIVVASVLYKTWSNQNLQERMDSIIDDIPQNKWFVSMECLFRGFDYALESADGTEIVQRNKATAFLTKHLKAYGGDGYFEDRKIGRVLKDFVFSGKGLVDKPANEESIIFNNNNPFNATKATLSFSVAREKNMSDVNDKAVASLQAQVDELKADKEQLEKELKEASASKIQEVKDELKAVQEENQTLKTEAAQVKEDLESKEKEIAEASEKLEASEKAKEELQGKIDELNKAQAKAARVSQLVEAKVSKEDAEKIVDKWVTASDEQFADIVELHAAKNTEETSETEEAEASEVVEEVNDELEEAEASTENVEIESEQDDIGELETAAASWLDNVFNSK